MSNLPCPDCGRTLTIEQNDKPYVCVGCDTAVNPIEQRIDAMLVTIAQYIDTKRITGARVDEMIEEVLG